MTNEDVAKFTAAWGGAWAAHGRELSDDAILIVFESLRKFELPDVLRALGEHLNDPDKGQYPPKPADIALRLEGTNKLPTPEQLVGLALSSKNDQIQTPIGMFARMSIGDYELGSKTMFELKPFAEKALAELPDWIEQARNGKYGANVLALMVKHGVSPAADLAPGIKGPNANIAQLVGQQMLHLQAPAENDEPEVSEEQAHANVLRLASEIKKVGT